MSDNSSIFPVANDFLILAQSIADESGKQTDRFCTEAGKQLPRTLSGIGNVLSILYRLACCQYGCNGGDHQIEWLVGKLVNQAISAHRLVRSAQYDEALMLVRGIGEIANLLWLFQHDRTELVAWKAANKKARLNHFGPAAVRRRLEEHNEMGPPIDSERYSALCEIGTHPVPGLAPGHYSGTGRPVLGIIQEVGIFVGINELAYAVAMTSIPAVVLLECKDEIKHQMKAQSVELIRSIGTFTALNYEQVMREALARSSSHPR